MHVHMMQHIILFNDSKTHMKLKVHLLQTIRDVVEYEQKQNAERLLSL